MPVSRFSSWCTTELSGVCCRSCLMGALVLETSPREMNSVTAGYNQLFSYKVCTMWRWRTICNKRNIFHVFTSFVCLYLPGYKNCFPFKIIELISAELSLLLPTLFHINKFIYFYLFEHWILVLLLCFFISFFYFGSFTLFLYFFVTLIHLLRFLTSFLFWFFNSGSLLWFLLRVSVLLLFSCKILYLLFLKIVFSLIFMNCFYFLVSEHVLSACLRL